ncbi:MULTISPECIES: OmpP1/FadL family transporter [Legionella]|uniref:Aromatic hydrocarbon degradation protein n=2 Tax=Legionella septentrionalis TaxID=2498109 RepID=A0A3S0V6L4_9GAMM|nr:MULTISPECIES: outer membrane protein transport protein [Legionella]MCP0913040.1 outer membrane protein transport protein [Legionella sp. 27cVA30]RUQ91496.1 hypothetical protein EKM59_00065 [Legionella septentrionalis]RUR10884.1 hypothetical protein ELY14_03515 [Legionella septentrionalis]RUR14582.1 hypothetical protein ELY10_08145 [Legionella septentrionalis]
MRYFIIPALGLISLNTYANVIQYFTGISYANPAELFKIKQTELIIGGTGFHTVGKFEGSVLNFNTGQYGEGSAYTRTTSLLPYGRIAKRFNEKTVFAVDVTQPFHSNLNWDEQAFTRYAATQTYLTDIDISPRLSYSLSKQWYVGAGINLNFLQNNETNWALPINPTASANMVNRTTGFGTGYDLGIYHVFNQSNFLGLVYYSAIRQNTSGTSMLANRINPNLQFNFSLPATTVLSYVHLFNEKWLTNLQVFVSEWDVNQYVRFINTSAPPPLNPDFTFTMRFRKSAAFVAAIRHQYTQKTGLTLIGVIDHGPEKDEFRPLNFPSDTQYFLALAGDYRVNENTTIELLYGYGYEKTFMNNHVQVNGQNLPFTTGKVHLSANVVDLRLKIQA